MDCSPSHLDLWFDPDEAISVTCRTLYKDDRAAGTIALFDLRGRLLEKSFANEGTGVVIAVPVTPRSRRAGRLEASARAQPMLRR